KSNRSRLIMAKPNSRKRTNDRSSHANKKSAGPTDPSAPIWLWGTHAVEAALASPQRKILELKATPNAIRRMRLERADEIDQKQLSRMLPDSAVHQGVAVKVKPLAPIDLDALIEQRPAGVVVLDQLSDPHNLGAVIRSAAAFGIKAFIAQTRHTPPVNGPAAKAAVGAAERVTECRVVNIARALDALADAGFDVIGLDGGGDYRSIDDCVAGQGPVALVMGAEGAGLRPAVAKACTELAKIPMMAGMESLNLSNAAAISFYELAKARLGL
ncbi:MAG: RNA methyltransferase, partial [Pseudomonadota bacterium]